MPSATWPKVPELSGQPPMLSHRTSSLHSLMPAFAPPVQALAAVQLAQVTAEPAPAVEGAAAAVPAQGGWGKLADQPPEQFMRG